jgi:hypothetical protein
MSSSQQLGIHNETRQPVPLRLQLQDGRSGVLRPVDMVAVTTFNHEKFIPLQQALEGSKIPRTPFN